MKSFKIKKFFIRKLFTLNIIVFAIMVWAGVSGANEIFNSDCDSYFMSNFIKPHHQRKVSQFDVMGVNPGDTVFLGDSITEGGAWHELFPKNSVRNRGIGGDVSAGVLARLDQITNGKPAQVFLLIGTNDIFFNITQENIVTNIVKIIKKIQDVSPQTEVFVQSILPMSEKYKNYIESLNHSLKASIVGKAIWINLYPLFLNKAGVAIDNSFSNDGVHLNGKGYLVWKAAIANLVNH